MTPLPRRRTRSRSSGRLAPVLLAALLGACAAPGDPAPGGAGGGREAALDPTFLPSLEALQQAVELHEDALAESILERILARGPEGPTLELARRFERILVGRRLVASLELRLVLEPVAGEPGELRALLVARHEEERDLVLRMAPASLRRVTTRVGANAEFGLEQSGAASRTVHALDDLELPAGATVVLELDRFTSGIGTALAVRDHVVLEPRAGHVLVEGVAYPAQDVTAAPAESVRRAPWLPLAPVPPDELLRYVRGRSVALPPLMERAVRIPEARRAEALDRLTAALDELGDNRVHEIVPALRWLARTAEPGGSPAAWRRWLEQRLAGAEGPAAARAPLDLPAAEPGR